MISISNLYEGIFFSDKNISVDLHKFESGEINKLLILGLSGSGKTTLGQKLAKKYNALYYGTDGLYFNIQKELDLDNLEGDNLDRIKNFIQDLFFVSNKKLIIEGIDILLYAKGINKFKILTYPVILLGTNYIKSNYRALNRNYGNLKDIKDNPRFLKIFNYNLYFYKEINKFKQERINQPNAVVKEFKE